MSKKKNFKRQPAHARKKKIGSGKWRQMIILGALLIAAASMILPSIVPIFSSDKSVRNFNIGNNKPMPDPQFTKEGELSFIQSETGREVMKIAIEKADNDLERQFGLMYRKKMEETQGMLFVFDQSEPQSFWMKNTLIPLDIMFVDDSFRITTIHENTKPLSEAPIPSNGEAKYVVETVGGFAKKHGLKVGDLVKF